MSVGATSQTKELRTGHHDRRLAGRLAGDPEFKAGYERQRRVTAAIDEIVRQLDALRVRRDYSKAHLAGMIDKHPASVRRLMTASGNPAVGTVIALADALDADIVLVPREKSRIVASADKASSEASK